MRARGSYSEQEYERIKVEAQLEEELRYARDGLSFFEELERDARSTYRMERILMKMSELTKNITDAIEAAKFDGKFSTALREFLEIPSGKAKQELRDAHSELRAATTEYLECRLALAAGMPIAAKTAFTSIVTHTEWTVIVEAVDFPFVMEEGLESIKRQTLVVIPSLHETSDGKSVPILNTTTSALQSGTHKSARLSERPTVLPFSYVCSVEPGKRGGSKGTVTLAFSVGKDMTTGTALGALQGVVSCGFEPFVREGKNSPNLFNRIKLVSRLTFLEKPIDNELLQDIDEGEDGKEVLARHIDTAFNSPKFDEDGRLENSVFE